MRNVAHLVLTASCIFVLNDAHAQEFPGFGKLSPKEITMTSCSFDKEASAVILVKEAYATYDDDWRLITDYHVRIKILKDDATDLADVSIPYYASDGFEEIVNVEGMTINVDENGTRSDQPLESKSIYRKRTNEKWSEVKFSFPAVRKGSILEYKYRSVMKNYGGLEEWVFQDYLPVVKSHYDITIAPNLQFAYQVLKRPDLSLTSVPDESKGSVYFEMTNIPGLRNEPYMDARRDYLQRVTFQLSSSSFRSRYMTSWKEVNREMIGSPSFGGQLNKSIPGTDDFLKLAKAHPNNEEKINMVYNYVRNNMSWNNYYALYADDGVKSAWAKKTGNVADINLILVNLMKEAGLEARPMLVSERWHGRVNTNYPFLDQFNAVYAFVTLNGRNYCLDARNHVNPVGITPEEILNTTGFVIDRKESSLVPIEDNNVTYRDLVTVQAEVDDSGKLKGKALVSSQGYARLDRLAEYNSNKEQYISDNFKKRAGTEINDWQISGEKNDSAAFKNVFDFTIPGSMSGDYVLVPLNLFSGFEENPFISDNRFSDIDFGYRKEIAINSLISYPDILQIESLPKSIRITNADKTIEITRHVALDSESRKISCRIFIQFRQGHFSGGQYPELKAFYKKMYDLLTEQLVLKKK